MSSTSLFTCLIALAVTTAPMMAEEPPKGSDKAKEILKKVGDFYKGLQSFEVTSTQSIKVEMGDIKQDRRTKATTLVQKPNRIALRNEGEEAIDLFSNGKKIFTSVAQLKKYTEEEAPADFDELLTNPMFGGGPGGGMFFFSLLAADPFAKLTEGVEKMEYLGTEMLGDKEADHLRFSQEQLDWDLWVAKGPAPVILKVNFDMSKMMKEFAKDDGPKMKMDLSDVYEDWKLDIKPPADAFTFHPPEGAQKVDSLLELPQMEEESSPLIGQAAPEIQLKLLSGGDFDLAKHREKEIVLLDFWATWCGPCVQEIPVLAEVAMEYKDKGVRLYAINQEEDAETIEEFLKDQELDVVVALDSKGEVGNIYGVTGIPMLAVIGKSGLVESVHVGFSPDLKETLRKELDTLLAGKSLAEQKKREMEEKRKNAPRPEGLEAVWIEKGRWTGVVVSPSEEIYALSASGAVDVFAADGARVRQLTGPSGNMKLRYAKTGKESKDGQLLSFGVWGQAVHAVDLDGKSRWKASGGMGIDDVWAADLDGDGRDEVLIGYNGATGLRLLDSDGKERWKYTEIGNVWHVCAGDILGDAKPEALSTSAIGQVHIFDTDGKLLETFDPGIYANMVRVASAAAQEEKDLLLVSGTGNGGPVLLAFQELADPLWSLDLSGLGQSVDSLAIAADRRWAAISFREAKVAVVDLGTGKIIAAIFDQGPMPDVAWLPRADKTPLLLIANGRDLAAYEVKPAEKTDTPKE